MKTNSHPSTIVLLVAAGALLASCGGGGGDSGIQSWAPPPDANPGLPETVSIAPVNTGDGWAVSSPTSEGMDSTAVLATLEAIRGRFSGVDSMVIVRHGRLVAEGYFNGFGPKRFTTCARRARASPPRRRHSHRTAVVCARRPIATLIHG
jgi:hypothetical protein